MWKKMNMLWVVCILVETLFACGQPPAPKLQRVSVRLCWQKNAEFAAIFNAIAEGFYAEEGLEIDVRTGGSGINPLSLVAAGSEDFGVVASSGLLAAAVANAKMPVKAIAALMQITPSGYMYILKEDEKPGQRTPKDWKGAKIGSQPEGFIYVRALAKMAGLEENDYTIVPVSYGPEPLLAGQVDYFCGWATNQAWILDQEKVPWGMILISDYIPFYADLIFARTDFLEKNPNLAQRFTKATLKGLQFAIDNPEKTSQNVINLGIPGLTREQNLWRLKIQNQMCVSEDTQKYGLGYMSPERWQKTMEIMCKETNELNGLPSVNEVMTNEFLP